MHPILGLNPIFLTILIIIGGVGLHIILGWLTSQSKPNPKKIVTSVIIGTFAAFGIVAPIIHQLSLTPATPYIELVTIIGALATIAGIDKLVKNTGGAVKSYLTPNVSPKKP